MIVAEAIEQCLAVGGLRAEVLRVFLRIEPRGLTDEELGQFFDRAVHEQVRTLRRRLCYDGLVERTDEKRSGAAGRPSTVWRSVAPERPCIVIEEVTLSHREKLAAREQLVGTIRRCYSPETVPVELAKLARWLGFKIKAHEVAR
jgi:hypothetical protein